MACEGLEKNTVGRKPSRSAETRRFTTKRIHVGPTIWPSRTTSCGTSRSTGGGNGKELEESVSQIEENHAKQSAEGAPLRRPPAPAYWLITKNTNGRIEVLTLNCKKTLPIFSHEEAAQMFLRLSGDVEDKGWRVTESGAGELVSMLYGLCAEVEEVALDPLPEMVAERIVGLVSLDRRCFIERMSTRRRALRHNCEEEGGRRSEVERIAAPYPAGRLA